MSPKRSRPKQLVDSKLAGNWRPRISFGTLALWLLTATYIFLFSAAAIRFHRSFYTAGDVTIFEQVLSNIGHGRGFGSTYAWSVHAFWPLALNHEVIAVPADSSYLGQHFEPFLLFLAPIHRVWPSPETMLVLQTTALAMGVWPIYLFAVKRLKSEFAGLVVAISYFLSPVIAGINLYNFHTQAFLVPLVGLCFYAAEEKRDKLYCLSFLLALMCNEVGSITLGMIALYIFVFKKRRWLGLISILVAAGWFIVVTRWVIPHFSLTGKYMFTGYFSRWGGSPLSLMRIFWSSPNTVLSFLTGPQQVSYLLALFIPLLFLPLLAAEVLLVASPVVLANLLADSPTQRAMVGHYSASVLPILYFAAIIGASRVGNRVSKLLNSASERLAKRSARRWLRVRKAGLILMGLGLICFSGFANDHLSTWPVRELPWKTYQGPANPASFEKAMSLIPRDASVSTQDWISTHLAKRVELYLFPVKFREVDYIFVSRAEKFWPLTPAQNGQFLQELAGDQKYQLIFNEGGYVLYKRVDRA